MLVNVSELRDYVMGARLIADITWNAPAVYAAPDPAGRFVGWWTQEYFSSGVASARAVYERYHALLDTPDRLWYASDAALHLVERLSRRVTGQPFAAFNPDTLAVLRERLVRLDSALSAATRAESTMTAAQQQFFSIDAGLGLRIDQRQTRSALLLADALAAPDSIAMWRQVRAALTPLEQLEAEFARAEYPPFDRWYHETWIRAGLQRNNPHRAYVVLRAFIANPSVRTP